MQIRKIKDLDEMISILSSFDNTYPSTLSEYAEKLINHSENYCIEIDSDIAGFICFYCNNYGTKESYISQIAVKPKYQKKGFATMLINKCIECSKNKMKLIKLEVHAQNYNAQKFYEHLDFHYIGESSNGGLYMEKII